jgi:DNA-binding LacI/PurR family transcriptional regulator
MRLAVVRAVEEQGVVLKDLAADLGVSAAQVGKVLSGKSQSPRVWEALAVRHGYQPNGENSWKKAA